MLSTRIRAALAALVVISVVCVPAAARADVTITVDVDDVFTHVDNISTSVERVTYTPPVLVDVEGPGKAYEMRGTVTGVGWGGIGIVARASLAHYRYEVTWLARWPTRGSGKTMVAYHHGGGPSGIAIAQMDLQLGDENVHRFAERVGDDSVGAAAMRLGSTYIATNRRGLRADGRFAAKFLDTEVAPLTQAEVDQLRIAIAPDDPTYSHPDLVAGAPVPATIATDTTTCRDIDRALQRVVADVSGNRFRERIAVSTSAGTVALGGMAFGRTAVGTLSLRTGGNHWTPYDATSPRIYDGFIFTGYVYDSATARADASEPLSAPTFFVQGRGDERYQQPIRMADELLEKGVTLDGSVWLYEIANLSHVPRDSVLAVPPAARNGEASRGYLAAAIRNMHEFLSDGKPPPRSRIAGRLVGGSLTFDVVGGTTNSMPVREDPSLDGASFGPQVIVRLVDAGATTRWQSVTAALDHEAEPVIGPSIACRIGGYQHRFMGTLLTPFTPDQLVTRYGSFRSYRDRVTANIEALAAQRLYDPKTEPASEIAERARSLFPE